MAGEFNYSGNGVVTWIGPDLTAHLYEDTPQEVRFDDWGIAGSTLNFWCDYDYAPNFVIDAIYNPFYPWLKRKTASIKREEANLGRVALNYEGVPPQTNDQKCSMSGTTSSESIDTHIKFATTEMAGPVHLDSAGNLLPATAPFGTPGMGNLTGFFIGANGAIFDAKGEFQYFQHVYPANSTTLNPFSGIKSFLQGGVTYTEIWTRGNTVGSPSDLENLGYIDNPPDPYGVLPVIEGYDWLLATADLQIVGFGSILNRKWRLSGSRGWNSVIYTPVSS